MSDEEESNEMSANELKSSKTSSKGKVSLTQMLKALEKDVAVGLERKLKKLSKKKAIKKPLDKNKADKIERKAAYSEATKEITKWDTVVEQRRKANQLKFPVDERPNVLPTVADSINQLKPMNDFEKQVQDVVGSSETVLRDNKEFTKAEEKYLKAISIEEAQERHRELQKMRVLLSSYGAKMRRQKLIKSKSYRRLLKREKIKKHMKNVESDKDALVEEINRLQKIRAQERASLKHKNTGKWAKHAKFRAKYDEAARQAMLEQIGVAKKMLEKPVVEEDSENSEDEDVVSVSEEDEESSVEDEPRDSSAQPDKKEEATSDRLIVSSELFDVSSRKRNNSTNLDNDDDEEMDDEEEEDEQRKLMSEAFADDDVVAEFKKAKDELVNEEQPKDLDLFLPGWGNWAGPGIQINKKKRKRYIVKAKKLPRKDDNLGNVIISENADNTVKELMVKKLPHGIKSDEHFTKLLSKPTAATFINQTLHRDSIRPRVVTKMGARIEPLSQKMLQSNKAKWA